mmetsp:Transcript_62988/g.73674  ORF Transcript_62988/g.73674 Transcript_62988/m.73674 type:complete len:113 (+) Transcript_62988:208-546(+)|eukprot:CAMPEP_0194398622 /NCGR_PEP_ID=MMETSP0174-20130528/126207_1 /TAXON_ID=216777 /ORGANISM="Proboscia alata, Strain PI-D3" /LENGTH=112 /DNA_ID=CAMNT_0039194941 /DNA_START=1013 /DNA_END=1351 /DNA_ORIENTATION=+
MNSTDSSQLNDFDDDFDAAFRARVKKDGGVTGVKLKVAKKAADSATRGISKSIKSSLFPGGVTLDGLLSNSQWSLTVGFLALVVVLAVFAQLSSPEPFETSSTGEQLGFGLR